MSKIKTSISFTTENMAYAIEQANKYHGGVLTAYLEFLVSLDKEKVKVVFVKEENQEEAKDEKLAGIIDGVLEKLGGKK